MATDDMRQAVQMAYRALDIEGQAVLRIRDQIDGSLEHAIELLHAAPGKVVVSGLGKSGHIGAKMAATFASTGTPAHFVHASEALHGDSGMAADGDVAILISNSGTTAEVCAFGTMLTQRGIAVIAMTSDLQSPLAQLAKTTLSIAVEQEADPLNLAPTTSTTATLAIGDALAVGLMVLNGMTDQDFFRFHPGGALGADLSKTVER